MTPIFSEVPNGREICMCGHNMTEHEMKVTVVKTEARRTRCKTTGCKCALYAPMDEEDAKFLEGLEKGGKNG